MTFVDTHAHLDASEFDADRGEVVARARRAGVATVVCPATSVESSRAAVRLAGEFDFWAAVGVHPNSAARAADGDWAEIVALAGHERVVALGETGLDRYRDYAPFAMQQDFFDRHLELSRRLDLPVVIHCRDAQADVLEMLARAAAAGPIRGVLHAMSGDAEFAAECVGRGLFVSFAGNVTYSNKKFEPLRQVARKIPADRLLVETDCPYLVPQAFRGRQPRNEPANVVHTATFLAELRGVPVEQLAAETTANARRLFRLPVE